MVRDNHHVSRCSRADGLTQCCEDHVWRGVLRFGLLVEPPLSIQYHDTDAVFIHNNGPRLTALRQKTHLCLKTFAIHIFLLSLNSLQAEFLVVSLNCRDEVLSAEYHNIRASQGTKVS